MVPGLADLFDRRPSQVLVFALDDRESRGSVIR